MSSYTYNIFEFKEKFTSKQIRNIETYEKFTIHQSMPLQILISRILMGNILINIREDSFQNKKDYFTKFPISGEEDFSKEKVKNFKKLVEKYRDAEVLAKLNHISSVNQPIFVDIFSEITSYMYYTNKKSYTTAFLHIYRCFEYISYIFPLIYLKSFNNYHNSYKELKKWLGKDDNSGELKFFEKFINDKLYQKEGVIDLEVKFEFPPEVYRAVNQDVKKIFSGNDKIVFEDSSITVPVKQMHYFLIELRNKHFHYLSGKNEIRVSSNRLLFDEFFQYINEIMINWLAYLFNFIIESSIDEIN